jgi:hypothetical protein
MAVYLQIIGTPYRILSPKQPYGIPAMNIDNLSAIAITVPAICFVAALWPLLWITRLRPGLLGAGGSGFIAVGTTIVGLVAGGFVQFPGIGASARAADDKPSEAVAEAPLAGAESGKATDRGELVIERDTIEIPPGRPKWVGAEPNLRGKTHTLAVSSGPYAVDTLSRRALDEALVKATSGYIAELLGSDIAPRLIHYDARTIKQRFVKPENTYHDVARYSVGWMHENFALLEFGPDFRNELDRRWTSVRAKSRLAQTGLFSGAALLLVGSVFGYFRLDNATRGYYTGRLQFMTAAAILSVVGAGAVLAQWIHWL